MIEHRTSKFETNFYSNRIELFWHRIELFIKFDLLKTEKAFSWYFFLSLWLFQRCLEQTTVVKDRGLNKDHGRGTNELPKLAVRACVTNCALFQSTFFSRFPSFSLRWRTPSWSITATSGSQGLGSSPAFTASGSSTGWHTWPGPTTHCGTTGGRWKRC